MKSKAQVKGKLGHVLQIHICCLPWMWHLISLLPSSCPLATSLIVIIIEGRKWFVQWCKLTLHLNKKLSFYSPGWFTFVFTSWTTEGVHFINKNNGRFVFTRHFKELLYQPAIEDTQYHQRLHSGGQENLYSVTSKTGPPRQSYPIRLQENNNAFQESLLSIIIEINNMDQNQPITTYRRDLWTHWKKPMFPERSIRANDPGKKRLKH